MYDLPMAVPDCRSVTVPVCENDQDIQHNPPFPALGVFQLRLRDTIDFTVDFSTWIAGNGNPSMTNAVWTVAAGSPKTPTIVGQASSPQGKTVAVLAVPSGAYIGDTYWMDITASMGASQPQNPGDVIIPARVLVRRVNILVVNG